MDHLHLVRTMRSMMEMRKKLGNHNSGLSLSEDIMSEIFLWLPLKSLNRFKRLSKRWYFLISDRDNSYFRRNYLSTLSTRKRNRIVGSDDSAIMAGFFYQMKPDSKYWTIYDRIQYIPAFLSSLDGSLDKFLSCCLHLDPDPAVHQHRLLVAGSSNGFLLLSLECVVYDNYYLFNPVTMECLTLPKRQGVESDVVYVGFVCKGDYPSLDLVEYTIVRLTWLEERVSFLFELLSSTTGDNEWSEYRVSGESSLLVEFDEFDLSGQHNTVIVSTSTTTNNEGGGGSRRGIVVYFLVMVLPTMAIVIVVFDLNKGDKSLQIIETPGPDRGTSVLDCADYIREFDDGVIHYVRIFCSTHFEFWVYNTRSGEWYLKHRASLKTMTQYPWMDIYKWMIACDDLQMEKTYEHFHIHAFHPMNPNLIFLTLYGRLVCYNVETGMLELVYDFTTPPNIKLDGYCHYVYQWPCWPPLL